jgi:hypothetical protein
MLSVFPVRPRALIVCFVLLRWRVIAVRHELIWAWQKVLSPSYLVEEVNFRNLIMIISKSTRV